MYFHALLFDLDGTLIDSLPDITSAVNRVFQVLGRAALAPEQVREHVGQGAAHLLMSLLDASSPTAPEVTQVLPLFLEFYESHVAEKTVLFPGILEMLRALPPVPRVVISNKPSILARRALESLQVDHWFEAVHGGDDFERKKPHPQPLLEVLLRLGVSPSRAVMVGDSQFDIQAGRAAGVVTCGVTWGMGSGASLVELSPDILVHSPEELSRVLATWNPVS